MTTTTEKIETGITIDEIKKTRDELKSITSKWGVRLAEKLFPEVEFPIARERMYNIVNGANRSSDARNNFIIKAAELKAELLQEAQAAREILNKVI